MSKEKPRPKPETQAAADFDHIKHKQILHEMPAYLRMRIFEKNDVDAGMRKYVAERNHWRKTIKEVDAYSAEEIVKMLADAGIDASRDTFLKLAEDRTSAFDLSEVWCREGLKLPLNRGDDAFLRLLTCKLWQNWLRDRPSTEMIDDWMQEGYTLLMAGNGSSACDRWAEVWKAIRTHLTPKMHSTDDADKIFHGTQNVHDWLQDFLLELQNAAIEEPRFADTAIALCNDILAQFPDEIDLTTQNWRGDLGASYYLTGRLEEGESVLQNIVRDFPDHSASYVRFAEILGFGPRGDAPIDRPRAITLIKEAITRPVIDAAIYDLDAQLRYLEIL